MKCCICYKQGHNCWTQKKPANTLIVRRGRQEGEGCCRKEARKILFARFNSCCIGKNVRRSDRIIATMTNISIVLI